MISSFSIHHVLVYCFTLPYCSGALHVPEKSQPVLGGICLHNHSFAGETGAYHLLGVFRHLT